MTDLLSLCVIDDHMSGIRRKRRRIHEVMRAEASETPKKHTRQGKDTLGRQH